MLPHPVGGEVKILPTDGEEALRQRGPCFRPIMICLEKRYIHIISLSLSLSFFLSFFLSFYFILSFVGENVKNELEMVT